MAAAAPASAQARSVALSGSNGVIVPSAPFGPASIYTGAFEVALSPRVAVRPSLLWAESDVTESGTPRCGVSV